MGYPSLHSTAVFYSIVGNLSFCQFVRGRTLARTPQTALTAGRLAALTMIDYQMETVRATARAQAERLTIHTPPYTHTFTHSYFYSHSQSHPRSRSRLQSPPAGAHEPAAVGLSQPTQQKNISLSFCSLVCPSPFLPLSISLSLCRSIVPSVRSVFPQVNCNYT